MQIDTATKALLRNPAKRRAWVIYQLKLTDKSLASIAREAGVDRRQTVKAMSAPYPKMEALIARALGLTPQELFPDRYDADGLPNRPMGRPKNSGVSKPKNNTATRGGNVKDRRAA